MRVVVDTNIVFSAILNSSGLIGDLLFNTKGQLEFFAPEFMGKELSKYRSKLSKATSMNDEQLEIATSQVLKRIQLISAEAVSMHHWIAAHELTHTVDEKDTPFVASALSLNAILWTGDKKLTLGIEGKSLLKILDTRGILGLIRTA